MRHITAIFALSAAALLVGCGGGARPIETSTSTLTPPATPNVAGNWQFSALPATAGKAPLTIAGGIGQSDSAINAAVHVLGSSCFDQLTTVQLTGKATGASVSLTSNPVDGQIVTFTGKFTGSAFSGTYAIKGGCADGGQGNLTGLNIPYIANAWSGTFTDSAHETFNVTGNITQRAPAGVEASYPISGDATLDGPCFKAATVKSGAFPSGSFILGRSVGLEFDTANGTITFLGTLSQDYSEISGMYSVSGGTCEGEGTAVLDVSDGAGSWDY